jgi:hypothetical protein
LHAGNNPERANVAQAPAPLRANLRFDPFSLFDPYMYVTHIQPDGTKHRHPYNFRVLRELSAPQAEHLNRANRRK